MLQDILEEKTKVIQELEIKVNAMEFKTSFISEELSKLHHILKLKSAASAPPPEIDLPVLDFTRSIESPDKQDSGFLDEKIMISSSPQNCKHVQQISPMAHSDVCVTSMKKDDIKMTIKYCNFCDEDFDNVDEYAVHMKKHGFMCNNCLDYFSEKPWFSHANLAFIRTGAVLKA